MGQLHTIKIVCCRPYCCSTKQRNPVLLINPAHPACSESDSSYVKMVTVCVCVCVCVSMKFPRTSSTLLLCCLPCVRPTASC